MTRNRHRDPQPRPTHDDHDDQGPVGLDIDLPGPHSRRAFLRRLGLVAGAGVAAPWALELASFANASDQNSAAPDDYRALVCVFLYGGNDSWNTFIPNDAAGHAAYAAARGGLARGLGEVLPISPIDGFAGAGTFGFAPEFTRLRDIFTGGDAAVVANVGTLITPLDKTGYQTVANRPPQLFSHNDQQSFWQAGAPEGAGSGWAGRIADFLLDDNGAHSLFTSISASGNAIMMSGRNALQYQVSSRGVTTLRNDVFRSTGLNDGLRAVMEQQRGGLFPSAYSDTTRRGLVAADDLQAAIASTSGAIDLPSFFEVEQPSPPTRTLSSQLEIVARLIAAGKNELGLRRQVFFVGLGGFDNHSRLDEEHRPLLESLDIGLSGFYRATEAMGVADRVTTFTASDFGRTLVTNGDGSDHGWGGHHIVVGGAVRGNRVVGVVPEVADDGVDDVGRGRLLPTVSVDQYAATFARWLGVQEGDIGAVVPNLSNFAVRDLGLFSADAGAPPGTTPTTVTPVTTIAPPSTGTTPGTTIPSECICVSVDTDELEPAIRLDG